MGGAWRAIARLHMAQTNYPLRVIHHYTLPRDDAEDFLDFVAGLGREAVERMGRLTGKRAETLPIAAMVLTRLLRRARPKRLVFSALGLREGCLYDRLSPALRRQDPLVSASAAAVAESRRFEIDGAALHDWTRPLFPKLAPGRERLHLAACHLSDIAWAEHPDYRAEIAFLRTLRMPLTGIDHPGRAFLALALFTRHDGTPEGGVTNAAWRLLDEDGLAEAWRLGLALRLAFTLSAGMPGVLRQVRLEMTGRNVTLAVPARARALVGEAVERRLDALARTLDRRARIRFAPSGPAPSGPAPSGR